MASDVQDRDFFNVFDGVDGRPESVYLDMVERKEAEVTRARHEGREPNLDVNAEGGLPAGVGTPFVTAERRIDNKYYSNPSVVASGSKDVDPVTVLPVDFGTADTDVDLSQAAMIARERVSDDRALLASVDGGGEPDGSGEVESGPAPEDDVIFTQDDPEGV